MTEWVDRGVSRFVADIREPGVVFEDRLYLGNEFFTMTLVFVSSPSCADGKKPWYEKSTCWLVLT
jgi:hypothetical protein